MNVTPLELALLDSIAHNEMTPVNGARPEKAEDANCWVWIDEIANDLGVSINAAKGVLGSAVKKGLVWHCPEDDGEHGVGLSEEGFAVFEANF